MENRLFSFLQSSASAPKDNLLSFHIHIGLLNSDLMILIFWLYYWNWRDFSDVIVRCAWSARGRLVPPGFIRLHCTLTSYNKNVGLHISQSKVTTHNSQRDREINLPLLCQTKQCQTKKLNSVRINYHSVYFWISIFISINSDHFAIFKRLPQIVE